MEKETRTYLMEKTCVQLYAYSFEKVVSEW